MSDLRKQFASIGLDLDGCAAMGRYLLGLSPFEENKMADEPDIDTELYLRDGFPYATVCKVQLRDGRIGIGLFRQDPKANGALGIQAADKAALDDALENLGPLPADREVEIDALLQRDPEALETPGRRMERDHDLQAQLGQPARE